MSLLTPTANLMSNIMANGTQPTPEVGMGCTELMYTDRHACTIVEVVSPKTIKVQRDKAVRTDDIGRTDSGQQYHYEPNPEAAIQTVTLRGNGRWVLKGQGSKNGKSFAIGYRDEYYDHSF